MSTAAILFCYFLFCFGMSLIVIQGSGPFNILIKWRALMSYLSENLGEMFSCYMCFPCNLGFLVSILNWFFIPIYITPFNMVFADLHHLWYMSLVAMFMDGCITSGVCYIIYTILDYFDKNTPIFEDENPK